MKSRQDKRLTENEYWNDLYSDHRSNPPLAATADDESSQPTGVLGDASRRLWDEYIEEYFRADSHQSILEVGSAPGQRVLEFHRKFGYEPFGVEYTDNGAEINRQVFFRNGISPDNVIQLDFLDEEFQSKYKNSFDHVVSFGFIEHFTNPREIVDKHVHVLKPGGALFITIPNFRYLNFVLRRFYYSDFIDNHNLDIMTIGNFRNCFDSDVLEVLDCSYSGGFKFPEPTHTVPWRRYVQRLTGKLQLVINFVYNTVLSNHPMESPYFSCRLVCVCRKKA